MKIEPYGRRRCVRCRGWLTLVPVLFISSAVVMTMINYAKSLSRIDDVRFVAQRGASSAPSVALKRNDVTDAVVDELQIHLAT